MNAAFAEFRAVAPKLIDEATVLVRRYPQISSEEESRLRVIYPKLPAVQLALMGSDDELAPRLEAFRTAQAPRLKPALRRHEALFGAVLMLGIAIAWAISN